jgi:hypothetical protein
MRTQTKTHNSSYNAAGGAICRLLLSLGTMRAHFFFPFSSASLAFFNAASSA